jgi:hypothetical protein
MKQTHYLVIRADRTARVAKRPRIGADEIGIRIVLDFPDTWGKVLTDPIEIKVPDFAPEVKYEQTVEQP